MYRSVGLLGITLLILVILVPNPHVSVKAVCDGHSWEIPFPDDRKLPPPKPLVDYRIAME